MSVVHDLLSAAPGRTSVRRGDCAGVHAHLGDGRIASWQPGTVGDGVLVALDAEIAGRPVPATLATRFGIFEPGPFWRAWTAVEVACKILRIPLQTWLRRDGLTIPGDLAIRTQITDGVVVTWGVLDRDQAIPVEVVAQRTRMRTEFRALDRTGRGQINRHDYDRRSHRFLATFGVPSTSPAGSALIETYRRMWAALVSRADLDGDASVDEEEFITSVVTTMTRTGAARWLLAPLCTAIFDVCDSDADGRLGPTEFAGLCQVIGADPSGLWERFARLDRDEDGSMSRQELVIAVAELYACGDPAAPGTDLLK